MNNVYEPSIGVLAKIGSIVAHVEEGDGIDGHPFDWAAIRSLLSDQEVQQWLNGMRARSLLPLKRK